MSVELERRTFVGMLLGAAALPADAAPKALKQAGGTAEIPTAWELAWCRLPDGWDERRLGSEKLAWKPAEVPGTGQHSAFGLPLDQLYRLDHIQKVQWMRDVHWVYRTRFAVPEVPPEHESVYAFDGIDYISRLILDGVTVARHEGMFSRVEVPIARPGDHELLVVIEPFRPDDDAVKAGYSIGNGWDFAPKLLSAGIWDEARLLVRPRLRITGASVATTLSNLERADAVIHAEFSERIDQGDISVSLDGVSRTFPIVDAQAVSLPLHVPSPRLWWPNGLGDPTLVDLRLELRVPGRPPHVFESRTGLRSIARVPCEGQGTEDTPLQLVINNRKVYLKGVNWVPPDSCPGSIDAERYRKFLPALRDANVNFVRVWGGGLREKRAFYDLADELGLMVMQEFPLACRPLPRTRRFYATLAQEVTAIVKDLRHHPSIVIWSGGNEHYHYWDSVDSGTPRMNEIAGKVRQMFNIKPEDQSWRGGVDRYDEPSLALMGTLCSRLDPSRPYQITSALEGEGEVHGMWTWDPAIGDHRYRDYPSAYDFWLRADRHLYSECSVPSIANLETIRYVLATDRPKPPRDHTDPIWKLHNAFHTAWDELPYNWLDLPSTEKLFGPLETIEDLIFANQWMQAEGARFMIEELRRKMGRTSGVVWWGVNEPWPGLAGNTLIDYFGRPKLGMRFLKNAFRPTILSLRYDNCVTRRVKPELWLSHDLPGAFDGRYEVTVENWTTSERQTYSGAVRTDGYSSQYIRTLVPIRMTPGVKAHIACALSEGGQVVHRNDYVFASNEDRVPLDPAMVARMKKMFAEGSGA